VLSRKIGRSTMARDILAALEEFKLPVLVAGTNSRIAYAETLTAGSTVVETQPGGPAAREIESILNEIEEFTACQRPPVSSSPPPEIQSLTPKRGSKAAELRSRHRLRASRRRA
jgi:hypothetical protein